MNGPEHYSIPKEPGGRSALVLALVVHLALIAFLWIGVSWQSTEHAGVEAEVWDLQYREAAPKQAESPQEEQQVSKPDPKPVEKQIDKQVNKPVEKVHEAKADIALEQLKKRKEEAKKKVEDEKHKKLEDDKLKKAEAEKRKKDSADKRKQDLAEQKARERIRGEEMRRIAGGTGGNGSAPRSTGNNRGDPGYGNKVGPKIRSNTAFVVPGNLDGNPAVEYAIELLPDGSLRTRPRKLKSSGVPGFDDAVLRAIEKSAPFPADRTGKVPPSFILKHQPKG